ncbi:MAG: hypothetical protein KatS3mg038_0325 [Candidatus Kapaibacterium sp.]|nr:MAG: hypothetical protein KatS3mg038_0325 [Candidatus Kapabacteria bacterium]
MVTKGGVFNFRTPRGFDGAPRPNRQAEVIRQPRSLPPPSPSHEPSRDQISDAIHRLLAPLAAAAWSWSDTDARECSREPRADR